MSTLLLRLAAPLQSWGDASRFARRETRVTPTKSGVLGLLAAAQGRRRSDSLEDLLDLAFGVRADQPGTVIRDFQTAQRWETGQRMPLSHRFYLSDAVFLAAVSGREEVIAGLHDAVRSPAFPLFLGRRSCPPSRPVAVRIVDAPLEEALREQPWEAARWYRRSQARTVRLRLMTDVGAGELVDGAETVRDVPLSYDPTRREYGWREVADRSPVVIVNDEGRDRELEEDFFAAVVS